MDITQALLHSQHFPITVPQTAAVVQSGSSLLFLHKASLTVSALIHDAA